jgi:glucosamine--fructose-6-phosphate aminotransferase (isomerizing)
VSTLSYTATLQALGLLVDSLLGRASADWAALPDAVSRRLADDPEPIASSFAGVACVDVVGSGLAVASVGAASLLLREAAHIPTARYSTREYLHGPLETAGPTCGVLLFGAGREVDLAFDLARYGSPVVLITAATGEMPGHQNLLVIRRPGLPGLAGCVVDIVPVQLAAHRLAEGRGLPIKLRYMPDDTKISTG